jgi:hypothetical protein
MPRHYARTSSERYFQRHGRFGDAPGDAAILEQEERAAGDRHAAGFAKLYPELAKWLGASSSDFAESLKRRIRAGFLLTDGQLTALQRAAAPLPEVDVSKIERVFDRAHANGVQYPKLRLGEFRFSPAGQRSSHRGAIFVTNPSGKATYARISNGKLHGYLGCTDEIRDAILKVIADPAESALAYGRRTGDCAVCGRSLVATDSVDAGIGPVCAEKYFGGFQAYKELQSSNGQS